MPTTAWLVENPKALVWFGFTHSANIMWKGLFIVNSHEWINPLELNLFWIDSKQDKLMSSMLLAMTISLLGADYFLSQMEIPSWMILLFDLTVHTGPCPALWDEADHKMKRWGCWEHYLWDKVTRDMSGAVCIPSHTQLVLWRPSLLPPPWVARGRGCFCLCRFYVCLYSNSHSALVCISACFCLSFPPPVPNLMWIFSTRVYKHMSGMLGCSDPWNTLFQ